MLGEVLYLQFGVFKAIRIQWQANMTEGINNSLLILNVETLLGLCNLLGY